MGTSVLGCGDLKIDYPLNERVPLSSLDAPQGCFWRLGIGLTCASRSLPRDPPGGDLFSTGAVH